MGLLIEERLIIESLEKEAMDIIKLVRETELSPTLIWNILEGLMSEGFIKREKNNFMLSKNDSFKTFMKRAEEEIHLEALEIIESAIHQKIEEKADSFALHKVNLSPLEEKILASIFDQVLTFIRERQKEQKGRIVDQKVVFWGKIDSKDVVQKLTKNSLLSA